MKTFRQQNGRTVETPTMNGIFHLAYFQDFITKVTYLEIPYLHNAASFLIILPMKPNGLQEVQKSLTPGAINRFNLSKRMREIDLHLPKFQMQSTFNLKGALQKLGIKSLFSEQADLTRMTPQNVSLSAAAHSGFFGKYITLSFLGSPRSRPVRFGPAIGEPICLCDLQTSQFQF